MLLPAVVDELVEEDGGGGLLLGTLVNGQRDSGGPDSGRPAKESMFSSMQVVSKGSMLMCWPLERQAEKFERAVRKRHEAERWWPASMEAKGSAVRGVARQERSVAGAGWMEVLETRLGCWVKRMCRAEAARRACITCALDRPMERTLMWK